MVKVHDCLGNSHAMRINAEVFKHQQRTGDGRENWPWFRITIITNDHVLVGRDLYTKDLLLVKTLERRRFYNFQINITF